MPRGAPKYRLHKTGQAFIRIGGKNHYLGPYESPASRERYNRTLAEWIAVGRPSNWSGPSPASSGVGPAARGAVTVFDVVERYTEHAKRYYVKGGSPTDEVGLVLRSLSFLVDFHASTPATEFGPSALRGVRDQIIATGVARSTVNKYVGRIKRAFRWAVAQEMIPATVFHALQAVDGLRAGRSAAREAEGVHPVPEAHVLATLEHLPAPVAAMVQVQLIAGMRPGEVVVMRARDIDMTGDVWIYRPPGHKNEHHGQARDVYLGPKAQEIVRAWLTADLEAAVFPARGRRPYTEAAYRRAITRVLEHPDPERRPAKQRVVALLEDGTPVPWWTPGQLRHTAGTRYRSALGLEIARVILGHSMVETTQVYAERDAAAAAEAVRRLG